MRGALSVDEGGVRCVAEDDAAYVPFETIADVEVRSHLLQESTLVLVGVGESREIHVVGSSATSLQRAILEELLDRKNAPARPALAALQRRGRALLPWLRDASEPRASYREGSVDLDQILAAFEDAHANHEERAAAGFVLLERVDESDLVRTMQVFLTRLLPPLVIAAARLARGGATLVPEDVLMDARLFLTGEDRAALDAAIAGEIASEVDGARVRDAIARAAEVLRTRPVDAEQPRDARARARMRPSAGALQPDRWIGRSWGI